MCAHVGRGVLDEICPVCAHVGRGVLDHILATLYTVSTDF